MSYDRADAPRADIVIVDDTRANLRLLSKPISTSTPECRAFVSIERKDMNNALLEARENCLLSDARMCSQRVAAISCVG